MANTKKGGGTPAYLPTLIELFSISISVRDIPEH
jgi:hypothetical protein